MTDAQVVVLSFAIVALGVMILATVDTSNKVIVSNISTTKGNVRDQAIAILVEFGYNELDATYKVEQVIAQYPSIGLQELINEAIRR